MESSGSNLDVFHGTSQSQAIEIEKSGFTFPRKSWPGDLGYGIYTFSDLNSEDYKDAYTAALTYAKKYRDGNPGILKVSLNFDESDILDLDNEVVWRNLVANVNTIQELVDQKISELEKMNGSKGAFKRGNLDGIMIEEFLSFKKLKPKLIIKERWEDIYDDIIRRGGQIPNSTVVVVREKSPITHIVDVFLRKERNYGS
ncbi:hypothetical protein [Leuconostoc lactis]|uniref:hypothetical protein n=1 Tax=Leuconostoc lactis TaxID=1246 RepID=UPI0011BB3C24|nr:hypothetical protein [Leuconostoc lactis]QEA50855.1 hypothetical protein FGL78_04110 [Leuconostoc lactis]